MRNLNVDDASFAPARRAVGVTAVAPGADKVMMSLRVPSDLRRRFYMRVADEGRRKEECLAEALELWLAERSN